ncbi:asparagine synthase C-terminal domain-containing protein, partial [Sulfurihydrogenibium sp.]|uniref:asparagine synthase-related protein n=1 Tax=Sulfurihydrogenibium sp. TaxID=2053621 RepID=UPI00261C4C72
MKAAYESGVKVLLDGQGGDELFTGYIGYYPTFYRELIRNFDIVDLYNEIKSINNSPVDLKFIFKSIIKTEIAKNLNNNFLKNFLFKNKVYQISLLKDEFFYNFSYRIKLRQNIIPNNLNQQLYQLITGLNLKTLLKYEDRNSMRFSIESRTPFADDINLIEYMFKVPSVYKIHNGYSKYILRQAMKGILPEQIRKRVDKVGFATPEDKWLKENKDTVKDIIVNSEILKELVKIDKLINEIDSESIYNQGFTLWRFLNLTLWYNIFMRKT